MIALDLIAAHMVGDFLLQPGWMAERKLADWRVRLVHVLVYSLPFALVVAAHRVELPQALIFLGANAAVHFVIDSRRWASDDWPPRPMLIDQSLHAATLAALAYLL